MSGVMKTVSKHSLPAQTFFFFFSKIDEIKIIKDVNLVSSTLLYSNFYCSPFFIYIFSLLRGLEVAFRSCEIKVHMVDFAQIIDTVFINPVIYIY